jgi:cell division protein FtsN
MKRILVLIAALCTLLSADNFVDLSEKPATRIDTTLPPPRNVTPPKPPTPPSGSVISEPVMTVSKLEFWVQMGAFSNPESAKVIEAKLKGMGLNAKVFPSNDLNRVAVGPYATHDQASKALAALKEIEAEAFLTTPSRLIP